MKSISHQSGISLLEVLASVTLFALVASALTATTMGTIRFDAVSNDTAAASTLVQDEIERFRALNPAANPADLTAGNHNDALNPLNGLGKTGGKFTRTWTVTPNTPQSGVSMVVVTVTWNSPETRSLSGVTYMCGTQTCS